VNKNVIVSTPYCSFPSCVKICRLYDGCGAFPLGLKTIGSRDLLQLSPPHVPQYGEVRPTNGWDLLASLGHPSKFQPVSRQLASLLHRRRSTDVNKTLHDVWPSSGLVHYTQWTRKKRGSLFLTITLANLNRFLYFLYHFNREEIVHATVVKFTTPP